MEPMIDGTIRMSCHNSPPYAPRQACLPVREPRRTDLGRGRGHANGHHRLTPGIRTEQTLFLGNLDCVLVRYPGVPPGRSTDADKQDVFAKTHKMAKQKFRPTRLGGFSGAKAYIVYVEVLKKHRNAVGRTFCDAIIHTGISGSSNCKKLRRP